jgi:hypothetical protein
MELIGWIGPCAKRVPRSPDGDFAQTRQAQEEMSESKQFLPQCKSALEQNFSDCELVPTASSSFKLCRISFKRWSRTAKNSLSASFKLEADKK